MTVIANSLPLSKTHDLIDCWNPGVWLQPELFAVCDSPLSLSLPLPLPLPLPCLSITQSLYTKGEQFPHKKTSLCNNKRLYTVHPVPYLTQGGTSVQSETLKPTIRTVHGIINMHTQAIPQTHSNIWCTHKHSAAARGEEQGLSVSREGSPVESLIDWDKGLLMREIAHQAGTTCFLDVTSF